MGKDGYGYGGVYNIFPDVSLDNVVLLFHHWNHLQVVLCHVAHC